MDNLTTYVEANIERFVDELRDLARRPSIAAQGIGLAENAAWVRDRLTRLGAEARLIEVEGGAPVVFGELGSAGRC